MKTTANHLLLVLSCTSILFLTCSANAVQQACWSGTWVGTYWFRTSDGCATDAGNVTLTVSVVNGVVSGTVSMDGIACYNPANCVISGYGTSSGPVSGTVSTNHITFSGNWLDSCNGQSYNLGWQGTLSGCTLTCTKLGGDVSSMTLQRQGGCDSCKATPTITWNSPAAITYGTAISSAQLNAVANVPGTFAYNPTSGTVLNVGTQTLSVSFTPTDTMDYTTATATVSLVVLPVTATVSGQVTCSCGNSPVAGATVSIGGLSTQTDNNGNYNISGVVSGVYTATVTQANYYTTNVTVTIPSASSSVEIDFRLTPNINITFYHEPPINAMVGHVFVSLTASTGAKQFYGFYPDGFVLAGPGKVADDQYTPWDYAISYPVTTSQYVSAARTITHDLVAPPFYTLAGFNCMAWAAKIASASGISIPLYKNDSGIASDAVFGTALAVLGSGGIYNCGTVLHHSGGANSGAVTTQDIVFPYDFSYVGIELVGHTNASGLATNIGLQFEHINLGVFNANVGNGISITLAGVSSSDALISMNWGDGSAFQEQCLTLSHFFTNGTYSANLLIIDNGAVHLYDIGIVVSSSPAIYTNITVTPYPAVGLPNRGLIPANWVPNYPPPFAQSIALLTNGHALITFTGAQGETYMIQSTTNLSRSFSEVTNITTTTDGVFLYNDANAVHNTSTFYRAVLP